MHGRRRDNLFVLEVKRILIDYERHEKRLIHHQGDGRFSVDGRCCINPV